MIIKFIIITIFGIFTSVAVTDFIRYRRQSRKLKQWLEFNKEMTEWSHEIVDSKLRSEYMNECLRRIVSPLREEEFSKMCVEKEIEKVYNKWSNHIPSLKQRVRELRLNKII
jgi:hypothetical protein